jgi:hypothetical protein|tara:strand:- start:84 stop:563 length:480 start_codon:yes stop_codon:yes gene_type:complete
MMPPLLTGDPYQDRINMEQFKVQEDAFNNRGGYFSEPLSVGQPVAPIFSDPVADDAGTAPRSTIMGYGGGSTSEQGIRQFLNPFLQQIQQENQSEMQQKIEPYVQEVQQITDRTFPNFTGFGALGGQMSSPMDNSRSFSNISQAMGSRSSFASSPYKMS